GITFTLAITDSYVNVLLGKGDGSFRTTSTSAVANPQLAVGDFNGDGRLDVVSSYQILLGNGDGNLQAPASFYLPYWDVTNEAAGDVNGDGKLDLVVSGGPVSVLLGNGDGTFQPPRIFSGGTVYVALADFNKDGKLDVVTNGPFVQLGNGDGTLQPAQ